MSSPRLDPAVEASRLAERALLDAAIRAANVDVKVHLVALAEVIHERPAFHVIEFAEHGWTIMHPLVGCGLKLFDCPVNVAAERGVERPDRYARFRCDIDARGRLVVAEEVPSGQTA